LSLAQPHMWPIACLVYHHHQPSACRVVLRTFPPERLVDYPSNGNSSHAADQARSKSGYSRIVDYANLRSTRRVAEIRAKFVTTIRALSLKSLHRRIGRRKLANLSSSESDKFGCCNCARRLVRRTDATNSNKEPPSSARIESHGCRRQRRRQARYAEREYCCCGQTTRA